MINVRAARRCGRALSVLGLLWFVLLSACSTPPATAPQLQNHQASKEEQMTALAKQQERLLAEVKGELAQLRQRGFRDDAERKKLEELQNLLQEIEAHINQDSLTRKYYWTPSQAVEPFRAYGDRLMLRLEAHGVGKPPMSQGKAIYGSAVLLFTIRSDGTLEDVDVVEASNEEIGWHAAILLREQAPFERFSAEISNRVDEIVFAQRFNFVRGGAP